MLIYSYFSTVIFLMIRDLSIKQLDNKKVGFPLTEIPINSNATHRQLRKILQIRNLDSSFLYIYTIYIFLL